MQRGKQGILATKNLTSLAQAQLKGERMEKGK